MHNTVSDLSKKLQSKETTAVALTQEYLERAKKNDLNAYVTIDEKAALESAKAADKMIAEGKAQPLTGIPFGIKDAISTKGLRTTAGSKILDNYIPPFNATVIEKIRAQGAVILGKNNMDEFAMGSSTETSGYGPTLNPLDKTRVPGGSSGGSAAAVADDLCAVSLGSDTGGSIRQPAAFCGIVGFKPTYGRVSRYGLIAMSSSLDQIGPLTKTAADAKIVFEAISGHDAKDATSLKESYASTEPKKKVGVIKEHIESNALAPEVKKAINESLEKIKALGYEVSEITVPSIDAALAMYYIIMPVEVASNLARFDGVKYGSSAQAKERVQNLLELYVKTRSQYFGDEAKRRIILGSYASSAGYFDAYYKKAVAAQAKLQNEFAKVFREVDFIVGPATPSTAFKLGEKTSDPMQMYLSDVFTVPANIAGLPSVSMPVKTENLPAGLQITGPKDSDKQLLDFAIEFENRNDKV